MRTECSGVEQSKFNSKFTVSFDMYRGEPGAEYVSASCTSAAVFDTEDQAYAGARRALDHLEAKGCFPNMCEVF